MLAAPLQSTSAFNDHTDIGTQYRPAKDLQAFNALLPPPIEFVKGSSTGTIAPGDGKYPPINAAPDEEKTNVAESRQASQTAPQPSSSKPQSQKQAQASANTTKSLYSASIDITWPKGATRGCGFVNTGNTCFLNSALQCLLHTPPLLRVLSRHGRSDPCNVSKSAFCMSCSMREVAEDSYTAKHSMVPYPITKGLHHIAKTMRKGRQEDSHEFLRYAVDALQKSCLAGHPPKIDPKLAETTWVHKIFGGQLRSRVTCLSCGYNSDTFDSLLDLSVDIYGVTNVRDALRKFVAVDHLRGADKYKCDKCKKHVTADKQFTVHEAPMVLTVHLKRFSPMGRKIAHPVKYDERLSLQPVMSEGQHGPTYSLFGVVSHAGGGPNSGHYYAHVKDENGHWHEMNDDSVTRCQGLPLNIKNAYMLFYIRDKGQALEAAVGVPRKVQTGQPQKAGLVAGMKKRKIAESDDEAAAEEGTPAPKQKRFIGPLLPAAQIPSTSAKPDPQAETLKRKIAVARSASPVKPSPALLSLSQYADEDEDDDIGERMEVERLPATAPSTPAPAPAAVPESATADSIEPAATPEQQPSTPPPSSAAPAATFSPISTQSFYGTSAKSADKKRKQPDQENRGGGSSSPTTQYARSPLKHHPGSSPYMKYGGKRKYKPGNPFNRITGGNNLSASPKAKRRFTKKW